ncbi:hypothetical protein RB595_008535 [Gaeumannomyces hyphopodioides]
MYILLFLLAFGTLCALATPAAYQSLNLDGSQATLHQFSSYGSWETDSTSKSPGAAKVLATMTKDGRKNGVFTAIVMRGAKTSIRGPTKDVPVETPIDFAKNSAKQDDDFVFTNGGFFRMSNDNRNGFSVGPSLSASNPRKVAIDERYKNDYKELKCDDGTFLWAAPSLKEPLNLQEPRFQYFEKGADGRFTKTSSIYAKIAGGLGHANQPNERLALVQTKQVKSYLDGTTIATTELALNLDGGGSLFVGYQSKGKAYLIVTGDQRGRAPVQVGLRDIAQLEYRAVANFVRHDLAPGSDKGGSSKRPAPDQSEDTSNKKPKPNNSPSSSGQPPKPPAPKSTTPPAPKPNPTPAPKPNPTPAPKPNSGGSGKTPSPPPKGAPPRPPAPKPATGGSRVRRGGPSARRRRNVVWETRRRN